jgi:pentatricopeptide repeat protein
MSPAGLFGAWPLLSLQGSIFIKVPRPRHICIFMQRIRPNSATNTAFRRLRGMNSSHICLACRRTLSRTRLRKVVQWHPRATFISLSDNPQTTTGEKSREDLLNLGNVEDGKKKRYIGVGTVPERRKQIPRQPYNDGDQLEALFEESLKQPPPEAKEIPPPITSVEPYIQADNLRRMLADQKFAVGDAWKFFVEHFGPEAWRRGSINQRTTPSYLQHIERTLGKRIIEAKRNDPFSLDLPTVTEFSKVYSQLGVLHFQEWVDMMLVLLESLIKLDQSLPECRVRKERVTSDLVGSWNVVFRQSKKTQDYPAEGSPYDWSHIPIVDTSAARQAYQRQGTQGLFGKFAPIFQLRSQYNMAVLAVTTFVLLTKSSIADKSVVQEASPLISSLGVAIATGGFDVEKITITTTSGVSSSVVDFLRATGSQAKETALNMQIALVENDPGSRSFSESRPSIKFSSRTDSRSLSSKIRTDLSSMSKRLYDAMNRRDVPQVDKLWSDASHFPVAQDFPNTSEYDTIGSFKKPQHGTLTAELCNYFIMIYMALRQPNRAIEVWNHMVNSRLPPDLKTWDSMLSGCKTCRDCKALEDVWMKMLHLRVQPDVVCWTTRISGLIECNKVEKAMYALDEMGRLWLAANEPKLDEPQKKGKKPVAHVLPTIKSVKPTIETINAAVSGLLRKRLPEAAHRVLAWAAKFNIAPNVITYNTLLMPLIRDGHSEEAMALLKQMQKQGIKADVGTFTTIMDEAFRYSDELTPKEQREIISNIFSEMDSAGIKANLHTYGKMIYQLLQSMSRDLTVVNVVLEHMAQQGIQPTAYIYTMLLNHYFSQEPADLDAVRNVVERAKGEVGSVDHIFWDRVIEGYARAGDTTAAMRVLGKHESGGNRTSWVTRQVLLTTLVQNDEWAVARSFVVNVKADTGGLRPDYQMKGQEGQQRFWRLAAELELL